MKPIQTRLNSQLNVDNPNSVFEFILMLVMVIILVFYISLQWPVQDKHLRAFSQQLAHDIRFTQHLAMSQEKHYKIRFTDKHYQILDHQEQPVMHPVSGYKPISVPNGTSIRFHRHAMRVKEIHFHEDGMPFLPRVGHENFMQARWDNSPRASRPSSLSHAVLSHRGLSHGVHDRTLALNDDIQIDILSRSARHHVQILSENGLVIMT